MDPATINTLLQALIGGGTAAASYFGGRGGQQSGGGIPGMTAGQDQGFSGVQSQMGPGGERFSSFSNLSPQQQQVQQQMLGGIGPLLQGLNPNAMREQAMQNFNQNIVPGIAERFTSMGRGGQSTEAFKQSLGGAGKDLELGLNAQGQGQQMNLLQMLLGGGMGGRESFVTPKRPSFLQGLMGNVATGVGYAAPQMAERYFNPKP